MALSQEQIQNAQIIAQVGKSLGASSRDILISLITAMQESGLRNLSYGDRDSVGLFQQRDAWGSFADRTDPAKAAKMFFTGGAQGQRGLFDFADRDSMSLTQAAQAVQVSAFPDAYAKHESAMRDLMGSLGVSLKETKGQMKVGQEPTLGDIPGLDNLLESSGLASLEMPEAPSLLEVNGLGEITADDVGLGAQSFDSPSNGALDAVEFGMATNDPMASVKMPTLEDLGIDIEGNPVGQNSTESGTVSAPKGLLGFAKQFLGTPYVWGGTSPSGFDCSGFVQYVFAKFGVNLPRISADQARAGQQISLGDLQAGDLVAWDNSSRNNGADHIAIYLGNGLIIEAPRPGSAVQINSIYDSENAWGVRIKR